MIVTLDRPGRRNALDLATLRSLRHAQETIAADPAVRVAVLTGAPPAFSAGADLDAVDGAEFHQALAGVLRGFGAMPMPVIAAIDGPALGGGAQLAVACDLRVATPSSTFGIPAAKLGLAVDRWTVERMVRELGWPTTRAMLLASEVRTGAQLEVSGGVHRLGDLDDARGWAAEIAALAPLTLVAHKIALEGVAAAHDEVGADDRVEAARRAAWGSEDAVEGRRAFLDKRRPQFTGR